MIFAQVPNSLEQLSGELLSAIAGRHWLLAASTALWIVFFALQGKAGFSVPGISDRLSGLSGKTKAGLVLAVAIGIGVTSAAGGAETIGVGVVLSGVGRGITLALGAMGIQGLLKALLERSVAKKE